MCQRHSYPIVLGIAVLLIRDVRKTKQDFTYERIARREFT